jgi:serine/threonine protein kinase
VTLPERLGRLERVHRIGVGGFASVWLYHDAELRSDVAVKALADNWAQRIDIRERFLEEARILRRADSDHIVRVYDIGEAEGTPYFVMTYADHGSLATLIQPDHPVPVARAVDIAWQACEGLAVLHAQGVVHRDIKPHNLLLHGDEAHERVLVADLGVAKAMLHASGLTQVVGTPAYMAPEQARGTGVDARADVHALGAVTYHMVTGHLVRDMPISELAGASLPPRPSSLADVPLALDDVLLRSLEPDPDDRWPDASSFARALRHAVPDAVGSSLERQTLHLTPTQPPPPRRARLSGPAWALVCLLAFAVAFGAAYATATQLL